ncbi:MAG: hypothetical protein BWK79_18545, partial [Beggiatoa sp. IS2]
MNPFYKLSIVSLFLPSTLFAQEIPAFCLPPSTTPASETQPTDTATPRIIGGETARAGDYPWMVALVRRDDSRETPISLSEGQ